MPFIETNGVSLHYKLEGAGPAVILLHEIGGSLDSWDGVVPGLSQRYRVLRYDQRGFGLSEKIRAQYGQDDLVDDLDALLRDLKLVPPFHIVSLAASSMQALTFNARHPEQIGSLVFCNPAPGVDPARAGALESVAAQAEQGGIRAILPAMLDKSYPPPSFGRAAYESYRGRYLANDPAGFALAFRMMARTNMLGALSQVTCPALVVAGRQDAIRAVTVTEGIAKKIPGARFEIIDAGHFMPTTSPQALLALLLDFFLAEGTGTPMKVKANGIHFHCRLDGAEGAPWLVFSNSLATDLSLWDEQVAALKTHFRILRYDQRGHGGTDAPAGQYDFDTLIADVAALFDELSIARAHFAGLSMGGMTALGLAQRHPARVDKLAVCDCGPASTPQSARQWDERIALARAEGMDALVGQTIDRWFPAETIAANPPFLAKVRAMIRTTPVNGYIGCAGALSDFDFRAGLGAMTLPVLLIVGARDAAAPGVQAIHAGIPGSKLVELEGAGHLSNIDASAGFTQALENFLKA